MALLYVVGTAKATSDSLRGTPGESDRLDHLQDLVGGYIEMITLRDEVGRTTGYLVFDEDGKEKGMPYNALASSQFSRQLRQGDFFVGPVLLLTSDEIA